MRRFLPFSVLILILLSCGKDETPKSHYYFKATLNGEQKDFLHLAAFQGGGNDERWEHIVFSGNEGAFNPSVSMEKWPPSFEIEMWNMGGNISAGTYTLPQAPDTGSPDDLVLDGSYHIHTSDGTVNFNAEETNDFTLVITEISKENGIKGTFKGAFTSADPGYENIVYEVNDGEFYLPYEEVLNP